MATSTQDTMTGKDDAVWGVEDAVVGAVDGVGHVGLEGVAGEVVRRSERASLVGVEAKASTSSPCVMSNTEGGSEERLGSGCKWQSMNSRHVHWKSSLA